jgi:hypothetical protein
MTLFQYFQPGRRSMPALTEDLIASCISMFGDRYFPRFTRKGSVKPPTPLMKNFNERAGRYCKACCIIRISPHRPSDLRHPPILY